MNFLKKLLLFILTTLILSTNVFAISARSAVVIDKTSGRVLYSRNKDEKRGMASTTKIMTAICALEHENPQKIVTVSSTASGVEGSSMYLAVGEKLPLIDLISGLMIVSGNDAATAIAESVSGSVDNFAALMNQKAAELGVYNTNFTNPHGLSDENHYTTAHDLAKITAYAMQNPDFCEIVATKTKKLPPSEGGYARTLVNHNKFLSMYEGCTGVKTGFTKATGRCLVTAAEKNGLSLICVTLNDPDDWADHRTLLDSAFDTYSRVKIKSTNTVVDTASVNNASVNKVELVTASDLYIPLKDDEKDLVTTSVEPFETLTAPIKKGEVLGKIIVSIKGEKCAEFPLVAKTNIEAEKPIFKPASSFFDTFKKFLYAWVTCFQ